ncbi:MAG: hypothetical protein HW406_329, partial [Candidatus Brocadiaceae bacterium]|nr:hypothetical protein [Candidatus Brocadiaceae bacterium]
SLTTNLVSTLKKRFGERSLKQGEALGSEIIEKYGNINIEDIDFLTTREAYLTLKHINLALLFHPESSILQEAHHLLIQLNHGSPVDANTALCTRGKQALESGNINEAIEIYLKVLQTCLVRIRTCLSNGRQNG